MKTFIYLLFIGLSFSSFAQNEATKLLRIDTRSTASRPNDAAYAHGVRFEFKERNAIGVPGIGTYSGLLTLAPWSNDGSGNNHHQLNFNDGGVFYRTGASNSASWGNWSEVALIDVSNFYPTFGLKRGATLVQGGKYPGLESTNGGLSLVINGGHAANLQRMRMYLATNVPGQSYISWLRDNQTLMLLDGATGKLGIGTTDLSGKHLLRVDGSIGAREITVEADGWSDFVFEEDYQLPTLEEVEAHITGKGHLPEIPNEQEIMETGVNLGDMDAKLLQKIEELTLYLIEQNKQNKAQQVRIEQLEKELRQLKN